ncbi:squalene/phytoene synthase family protein [Nocardia sp. alder85J]|uniref:squalene/phytoene synthase family protein n=1 Tax=Nocardia sp. alder85J TaxID=2862949 RepID=UPI001CD4CCF8|nr:squalene/phytoene synthase family protein [Nocardia sp. alder85J]MCX4095779.1 squalene/phytoene synthase family protein [Nocardia sp. alder85J]
MPEAAVFRREMLDKTSRTFALTIPMLPSPLDEIVGLGYLFCRVADTFEDEAGLPAEVRGNLLRELDELVGLPPDWRELSAEFAVRAAGVLDGAPVDEVALVRGLPILLGDLARRPLPVRELVGRCVHNMTVGMAATVARGEGRPDAEVIADVDEMLTYCDIVASTVGDLLTGLFAWHSAGIAAALPALEPRAAGFARALQLTNIIKDVAADASAGRLWLPADLLADCGVDSVEQLREPGSAVRRSAVLRRMLAVTQKEFAAAVAYVDAIPAADLAVRRFCTAQLLMSELTLREAWAGRDEFTTKPIKISRRKLMAALSANHVLAGRPVVLNGLFAALGAGLPLPDTAGPPQPVSGRIPEEAVAAAVARLSQTQSASGSWHEDFGNLPMFCGMYLITCRVVDAMPDAPICEGMERFLRVHQNPDGGWGTDPESTSTVMSTVLSYIGLRILGVGPDDPCLRHARDFFLPFGGALAAPQWAKTYLAVLGVHEWAGTYPFPPETWLLPQNMPVHPGRLMCYARIVYLSTAWLSGNRVSGPVDDLILALRGELYQKPYEDIDWRAARAMIAEPDSFVPRSRLLRIVLAAADVYEARPMNALRERAFDVVLDYIDHENRSSNYVGHGPVPKFLDTLVWHFARPGGKEIMSHLERLHEYVWNGADGVKIQCFNSSESWDTAFAVQALALSGHPAAVGPLRSASRFLAANQRLTEIPDAARYFRHPGRGGWSLSTAEHGWTISDGTAEAVLAVSTLQELNLADGFTADRLPAAVECLLSLQNPDGGWAVYEPTTAPAWFAELNFSDTFAGCMIDSSLVEQTASCVTALRRFREMDPRRFTEAMGRAISAGEQFIFDRQRPDGSWEGSWAVCFTYGTWFGVRGLTGSSDPRAREAIDRACEFLLAHQRRDGGWGETIDGVRARRYIHAATGQATMTSWALLALVAAGRGDSPAARRAIDFLLRNQLADGGWQDTRMAGAFFGNAGMNYDGYQRIFPLWALAAAARATGQQTETGHLIDTDDPMPRPLFP